MIPYISVVLTMSLCTPPVLTSYWVEHTEYFVQAKRLDQSSLKKLSNCVWQMCTSLYQNNEEFKLKMTYSFLSMYYLCK